MLSAKQSPFTATTETPAVLLELALPTLFDAAEDHVELIRSLLAGSARERDEAQRAKARRAKLDPPVP
jgi:hypothetical protein